ncbi:branched-chain amino acid ABC transporter permease [Bradyrhizobium sp.]|uniref:branched-chain amino acid ABC transporter permease n=1 Tax=Bradyrhizobium sp. TaxID=376 RepID=UPI0039E2CA80
MLIVLLQAVLSGAASGAVYALMALGFSITFTTTRTLNFSHGEFLSTGAFIYVASLVLMSGGTNLSLPSVEATAWQEMIGIGLVIVLMTAIGFLLYLAGIRPFVGKPGLAWVVSTLGFGIILQSIMLALWGPGSVIVPAPVGDDLTDIFGAMIRRQELLVLVASIAIFLIVDVVMRRSLIGKVMRAVALNPSVASLMGIGVTSVMMWSFAVSSALAGLSGVLIAPIASASAYLGLAFGMKGFSAAIVGGLTSPRGCILGGFAIGILESVVNLWDASWKEVVIFALVIMVLVVRPSGLLGQVVVEKT